ncbi:unnamed protein product [Adineta steineri]|uniref:Uncharacterized protein n=1 Tax=Adineta steineri TaxID=433720 RepID=A0A819HK33_9BILA|nr:unnamed protein product [Adineta steineri]
MDSSLKLGLYDPINANESEPRKQHQHVTKAEYSPIGSSRKLNLLLHPILCELLFPLIFIGLLAFTRYDTHAQIREMNENPNYTPRNFNRPQCSQNRSATITTSLSTNSIKNCFKFPPSYKGRGFGPFSSRIVSNTTNFVFQPITDDTKILVEIAKARLKVMNCENTKVWTQNMDVENDRNDKSTGTFLGIILGIPTIILSIYAEPKSIITVSSVSFCNKLLSFSTSIF